MNDKQGSSSGPSSILKNPGMLRFFQTHAIITYHTSPERIQRFGPFPVDPALTFCLSVLFLILLRFWSSKYLAILALPQDFFTFIHTIVLDPTDQNVLPAIDRQHCRLNICRYIRWVSHNLKTDLTSLSKLLCAAKAFTFPGFLHVYQLFVALAS